MSMKKGLLLAGLALTLALAVAMAVTQAPGPLALAAAEAAPTSTAVPTTAAPSAAQGAPASTVTPGDPAADKTSVTVALQQDFVMDPYLLPVIGKGETAAGDLVKGCNGSVSATPNAVVNWSGDTAQLAFFVYSDADPVLVIQQPDGTYICNDDAGLNTVQPLLVVKKPAAGAYKVFAGTADKNHPALGFLGITETDLNEATLADLDLSVLLRHRARPVVEALPALDLNRLVADRAPIFGSTELKPGFSPVYAFAAGGGDIPAFRVADKQLACSGFVSPVASYGFTWTGNEQPVRLYFEALQDSSLAVVTPDRQVLCGTNAAEGNLNPVVDIAKPQAGAYKVYVAAMQPNTVVGGKLTITGDVKAAPAVLAPAGQ